MITDFRETISVKICNSIEQHPTSITWRTQSGIYFCEALEMNRNTFLFEMMKLELLNVANFFLSFSETFATLQADLCLHNLQAVHIDWYIYGMFGKSTEARKSLLHATTIAEFHLFFPPGQWKGKLWCIKIQKMLWSDKVSHQLY